MPAKYFPSLNPNGIDMNTMPNLSEVFTAPRGQDPMHYGFKGSKGPQSPFAPMVGQAADALMDPRLGMLPMVGGFRVAGGAAQRALSTAKTFGTESGVMMDQQAAQLGSRARRGAEILEREPLPHQQATTMHQPQGDQSMGKAITDLAASMGWSSEKMADWLVQNGFRSAENRVGQAIKSSDDEVFGAMQKYGNHSPEEMSRLKRRMQGDKSGPADDIGQIP